MKLNRTIVRAIEILELLANKKEGYTLSELTVKLNCPKSSVFDIIKTLLYKDMIIQDSQDGVIHYKIGINSFLIGSSYLNNIDMVSCAKDDLISLAKKMHATTFMAVLDENMAAYIFKYESENSIITTANVGTRRPIHCAALGKAMVAFYPQDKQEEILSQTQYVRFTEYTISNKEDLKKQLQEVKKKGYAIDDRENTLQQIAAAAPIFDHNGSVVAAISCVGFYEKDVNLEDLGMIVKETADTISAKFGYQIRKGG